AVGPHWHAVHDQLCHRCDHGGWRLDAVPAAHRTGAGAATMPLAAGICFGLIIGSFLNVCIHRLPRGESVVWPASKCPRCQAHLKPYDNIPIIGYLMLRGRVRSCGEPISVRYPIVELLTMAMFLGAYLLYPVPLAVQRAV